MARDARHRPVEVPADASGHEDALLDVDHLALGGLGHAFGEGDPAGDRREPARVAVGARGLAEGAGEHPVRHEVGVAADRRGEVQVVPEAQREMAAALRSVARLAHATQHGPVQERLLRPAHRAREGRREPARREGALAPRLDQPEPGEEAAERLGILARRRLVVAVDRGRARGEEELRHGAVRGQHRLFDRAVRRRARRLDHVDRHAVGRKDDLRRRQIEVERAHREAAPREGVRHAREGVELARNLGSGCLPRTPLALHGQRRLLVDEPRAAADHGRVEGAVADVTGAVDVELGNEREPVGAREERADERGQPRREHGDRAIREVDRVPAPQGLAIEGGVGPDVVGDVGDRDAQAQGSAGHRLDADRVVVVACGGRVDRDEGEPAQVDAPRDLGRRWRLWERRRGGLGLGREAGREPPAPDDGAEVGLGRARRAEDLEHATARRAPGAKPGHDHHVAVLGRAEVVRRHGHAPLRVVAIGSHERHPAAARQDPDPVRAVGVGDAQVLVDAPPALRGSPLRPSRRAASASRSASTGHGIGRVPGTGVEPALPCGNQTLNLARLPIPPPGHMGARPREGVLRLGAETTEGYPSRQSCCGAEGLAPRGCQNRAGAV